MKAEKPLPAVNYSYKQLSPDTWPDFLQLFGSKGASAGCWCMWSRTKTRKEFEQNRGEKNKQALQQLVFAGKTPGLLGYDETMPIGWCSLGPREDFPRLERTRNLQKIDEQPVWSIICLYVKKEYRRLGVTKLLLASAIEYVRENGGSILESYPADPKGETIAAFVEVGFKSTFAKLGFQEVCRRGSRPIMRYKIPET